MKSKKGFTLIEMLVVVLIIGILAAIAVPKYQFAVEKSRFAELIQLTHNIKNQQEIFYLANGYYAPDCATLNPDLPTGSYIEGDWIYLEKNPQNLIIVCSNVGSRVIMTSQNANLELQLDYAERTGPLLQDPSLKGFCRAHTELGQKICKELGEIKEGGYAYNYYF